MKILDFFIINNRHDKYAIVDVKKRVREEYDKGGTETAYATYRAIMGATVQESWRIVKPWIRGWLSNGN